MPEQKVPDEVIQDLERTILDLHKKARSPNTPLPQALALSNRAQELRDQLVELLAARFHERSSEYGEALAEVRDALAEAKRALEEIRNAVEIISVITKVFSAIDKLLRAASSFI